MTALAVSTPALANDLVPPEEVGLSSERLDRLAPYLETEVGSAQNAGLAISCKGQFAYFETAGYRGPARKTPMPRDAIFSIDLMTKPLGTEAGRSDSEAPATAMPEGEKRI